MNKKIDKTSTLLVEDLKKELTKEIEADRIHKIKKIIKKAEFYYYDDYQSDEVLPKMQLVSDLRNVNLTDIANKVIAGNYD